MRNKAVFFIFLMILAMTFGVSAKSYSIRMIFYNSNVSLINFELISGEPPTGYYGSEYSVLIYDYNQSLLYEDKFDKPAIYYSADPRWFDENGKQIYFPNITREEENISLTLYIPYFENAEKIVINRNGEKLLEINIRDYVKCNKNSNCETEESELSCPEDCKKDIETFDDSSFKSIKDFDDKKPATRNKLYIFVILGALIIITLILIIWLLNRQKLSNSIEP